MDELLNDMELFDEEPQHKPYSSRLGLVYMYYNFIQVNPEVVWRMMRHLKLIVVDARSIPGEFIIQYMGYSPLFEEWHPPAMVPTYEVRVTKTADDGEVFTVTKSVQP